MSRIKKVVITEFGDESKLAVVEDNLHDPGLEEVQVAVEYSIVSGSDVNMRRGTYPFQQQPPLTPGYSILGTLVRNGKGSGKFHIGDRVACLSKYEGHAERINVPEKYLVAVPEEIDPKQAVALVLDWVTAYQMLHHIAHIQSGQKIFVHGLSGGVGVALLKLAKLQDAQVFGTASSSKHEELQKLGAIPFAYDNKDWIDEILQRGGVDAVFDPLGYESFDESYSVLKRGGVLVAYGMNLPALTKASRKPAFPAILKLLSKNLLFWRGKRTTFFGLNRRSKNFKPDLTVLFGLLQSKKIYVPIKATFRLDEIQEAHRAYANNPGLGSILIQVAPDVTP